MAKRNVLQKKVVIVGGKTFTMKPLSLEELSTLVPLLDVIFRELAFGSTIASVAVKTLPEILPFLPLCIEEPFDAKDLPGTRSVFKLALAFLQVNVGEEEITDFLQLSKEIKEVMETMGKVAGDLGLTATPD